MSFSEYSNKRVYKEKQVTTIHLHPLREKHMSKMYHIFQHNSRQPGNNTNQDAQHDNKLLFLDVADTPHQKLSQ